VEYLKKTLCDLIDQKKDQLSSFLDSSDFVNYIHRYNKSLEKILSSKEQSIMFLQNNTLTLKNNTKDEVIYNILNKKNHSNQQILNQKIKNFKENFDKEFSKNNFYIHNVLSNMMNDLVYHSNIALMSSIKETLREDFGLLDKIHEPINLPGIQNFQNNGIQASYLLTQNKNIIEKKENINKMNQINNNTNNNNNRGLNMNMSIFNDSNLENNNHNFVENLTYQMKQNNIIQDSFFIQIIGLKISLHKDLEEMKDNLKDYFKCESINVIKLKDNINFGTRIYFSNEDQMNKIMQSNKARNVKLNDIEIRLKKKTAKEGNRFYVTYHLI